MRFMIAQFDILDRLIMIFYPKDLNVPIGYVGLGRRGKKRALIAVGHKILKFSPTAWKWARHRDFSRREQPPRRRTAPAPRQNAAARRAEVCTSP